MHLCLAQTVLTIWWLDKLQFWRTFWVLYLIKSNSNAKKNKNLLKLYLQET